MTQCECESYLRYGVGPGTSGEVTLVSESVSEWVQIVNNYVARGESSLIWAM